MSAACFILIKSNSKRVPGKPLVDICGKPMVWWVYQQAIKVKELDEVYVATDSDKIISACNECGVNCILTSEKHPTGVDRVAEVASKVDSDYYILIQGDEPLIESYEFLVDVFAEVYRKNSNAFLLLIDAGELMDTVKDKINKLHLTERVLILSHRSDIPQLLKAMDVFVFPSLFEGLGIVLIEAQVADLRCVVSDAVPKEAFQTELAVPVSLNESPEKWAEIVLNNSIKGKVNGNIDDYDMNKEIKRLEDLYTN